MTSFRSNKYKQILRVGKATIFGKAIKEVLVNMIVTIKYKQILRVGKGTIFGKANYASTSKYDCHNMIGIIWVATMYCCS